MHAHLSCPPLRELLQCLCERGHTGLWSARKPPGFLPAESKTWIQVTKRSGSNSGSNSKSDSGIYGPELPQASLDQLVILAQDGVEVLPNWLEALRPGGQLVEIGRPERNFFLRVLGFPCDPQRAASWGAARLKVWIERGYFDVRQGISVDPGDWIVTFARPRPRYSS